MISEHYTPEAVILANGEYPTHTLPLKILEEAKFVICCDGAANEYILRGHTPDIIIGDGDSLSPENKTRFSDIIHHIADQETNDQTKAVATQVNDSNFDAVVLQSQLPVLVDFWAPWCGPCRAIGPIIDELANEYEGKLSVVKLNVDESPSTPGKYGIRAIPTLILFKNGEVVEQVTGAVSKSSIATMIEQKALA